MRTIVVVITLGCTLAGCATREEIAARNAAEDDAKCLSYGSKQGDPAYVQCRAQLDAARTQADATAAAAPGAYVPPPRVVDLYRSPPGLPRAP